MDDPGAPYDADYFERGFGPVPYVRSEPVWLERFGALAEQLIARLAPRRVLDVGCAKGFLVEALRDRGVEAFGVDASTHALECVREDLRAHCWKQDAAELSATGYDLVTCVEVLEHMPAADAERALDALCAAAPYVLFSSSPDDEDEPTHVNVRPIGAWVEAFAARGRAPVWDADFSAFAPQVMLFGPEAPSDPALLRLYTQRVEGACALSAAEQALGSERTRCYEAERLLAEERASAVALRSALGEVERAQGWRLVLGLREQKERFVPEGTRQRRALTWITERAIRALRPSPTPPALRALRAAQERPRVLVVSGCGGDSLRYRGDHLLQLLAGLGGRGAIVPQAELGASQQPDAWADACELIVCQRTPIDPGLRALIAAARRRWVPVLFETDDLVCDPLGDAAQIPSLRGMVSAADVTAQHEALGLAVAALCSTEFLAERLRALGKPAYVLRNAASPAMLEAAARARAGVEPPARVVLGYASGSPTHDGDFASIAPALARVLTRFPTAPDGRPLELHLVGPVALPAALEGFAPRIVRRAFVPWSELPAVLASFSINLAPLETGYAFCQAKSEIKWLEAALVEVPTVASPTPAFRAAIGDDARGRLAADDDAWERALTGWIEDEGARRACAARALAHALEAYGFEQRGPELRAALEALRVDLAPGAP
ncbi:MAG: methyltransferase domain-containing protein [Planctomycetes bacterium]|nr:methyltransferase domain-containing protein [Planctomycetota bacterium]